VSYYNIFLNISLSASQFMTVVFRRVHQLCICIIQKYLGERQPMYINRKTKIGNIYQCPEGFNLSL